MSNIAPVRGDNFKIIINSDIFPKKDKIHVEIKFEYYSGEYGVTLSEDVLYMSGSIKERTDKAIENINTVVESSSLVDETGKNPSTFINDTLNNLYDKAIELRDDFIDGEDYTDHSMITIIADTETLEEKELLDEF